MTLVWPLPALLTWAAAWALFLALGAAGLPVVGFGLALGLSALLAWRGATGMRRLILFAGFPLSVLAAGQVAIPPLAWLLPLALLALLYPLNAWRDAPLFPTPTAALRGLAAAAPLPPGARVMDAGCGLGDGLLALRAEYPGARLEGLEWSWPLALLCRLRCRFARVRRGDIWRADWSGLDMVYLFQRPESMPRAMAKAQAELRAGAWLVSLEFEAVGWTPAARLETVPGKPVWIYRAPFH
ncbi:class I SAM-dependent methyltransferase [Ideonella sp. 4Y16]|uniref:class I SAM-dependent methyltransferase n=1 Tax=Ideonella alba TaxID=2824118 RepID=UPI001B366560|nr:class I SAM-dependent methyltransferase [Ideonella alba]MBQ0941950.1 class I SAM-dependent methyltransferase [Ideonella alba]